MDSRAYANEEIASETIVVDGVGQRLRLHIENVRGGGGQRKVSLFCPIWIVNTTEHSLLYRQDKSTAFVAGSVVSPEQNGSLRLETSPISLRDHGSGNGGAVGTIVKHKRHTEPQLHPPSHSALETPRKKAFAGTPGVLAGYGQSPGMSRETVGTLLEKDMSLKRLASVAFMFNFSEAIVGHQKLAIQLAEGSRKSRYRSDWSPGFSVDTIGVPQVVG